MAKKGSCTSTVIEPSRYVYQTCEPTKSLPFPGPAGWGAIDCPSGGSGLEYPALGSLAALSTNTLCGTSLIRTVRSDLALTRREGRMMLVLDDPV